MNAHLTILLISSSAVLLRAAEAPSLSAYELATRLSALRQDGTSLVRLRMQSSGPDGGSTLQLQIKSRRTVASTELVYQVLWPKERAGEAIVLRRVGGRSPSGAHFQPPDTLRTLGAAHMREPLFGGALTLEDAIDNPFAWDRQTLLGMEIINRANCYVLESRPAKGESSSYGVVRTWVDAQRLVPLRMHKLSPSGGLLREIETTRVVTDDGRPIPASLTIRSGKSAVTEIDGSRIRRDVTFSDREFTAAGLKDTPSQRDTR